MYFTWFAVGWKERGTVLKMEMKKKLGQYLQAILQPKLSSADGIEFWLGLVVLIL